MQVKYANPLVKIWSNFSTNGTYSGPWCGRGTVLEWLLPLHFRNVVGYGGFPTSFSRLSLWVGSHGHWASTETPCDSHTSLPPLSLLLLQAMPDASVVKPQKTP